MKFVKSGNATGTLTTTVLNLLGKATPSATDREFWLQSAWFTHNATTATTDGKLGDFVILCDATSGAAVGTARHYIDIPYGFGTVKVDFPGAGLKFTTACTAAILTCTAITNCGGIGYEVG